MTDRRILHVSHLSFCVSGHDLCLPWLRSHRLSHEGFKAQKHGVNHILNMSNVNQRNANHSSVFITSDPFSHTLVPPCSSKLRADEVTHRPPCVPLRSRWSGDTNTLSAGNKDTSMATYLSALLMAWLEK